MIHELESPFDEVSASELTEEFLSEEETEVSNNKVLLLGVLGAALVVGVFLWRYRRVPSAG